MDLSMVHSDQPVRRSNSLPYNNDTLYQPVDRYLTIMPSRRKMFPIKWLSSVVERFMMWFLASPSPLGVGYQPVLDSRLRNLLVSKVLERVRCLFR